MANMLREKITIMLIGFLLVSSCLLRTEAAENGSNNEYKVTGRKLLNKFIGYDPLKEENKHRPRDQIFPSPMNEYKRPCTRLNRCDHS